MDSIQRVVIGKNVATIGTQAFQCCSKLTRVTIPDSVTLIGESAFNTCKNLRRLDIGKGVETIGRFAFFGCTQLKNLTIGDGIKNIDNWAFPFCDCGNPTIFDGRNVIWCLEDGVLVLKKDPYAKSDADFSTGEVTWRFIEKNIRGVKVERGIKPTEKFFEWLAASGKQISFE